MRLLPLCSECSLSALSSLGYKPFLNLIQPQLQQLMEATSEQVQPEAFQPASQTSKLSAAEGPGGAAAARVEDTPLGLALPSVEPAGVFPRPPSEDSPEQSEEQQAEEEGTYDCTLS